MLARKLILGFGFAVLLPMLVHYGIDVFAPRPDSSAHYRQMAKLREEKQAASAERKAQAQVHIDQAEAAYDAQKDQSEAVHFFIGAPIGILVTLLGSFIRAQAIGGGLMLGGIFIFTGGCAWYWSELPRTGRFLVLVVAFIVLLWIGYQRLSELKSPKSQQP